MDETPRGCAGVIESEADGALDSAPRGTAPLVSGGFPEPPAVGVPWAPPDPSSREAIGSRHASHRDGGYLRGVLPGDERTSPLKG